jgi:diguanylate cyclase (GGDEF)-like protein
MNASAEPWSGLEPYVQLIRSLLPRASSVAVIDARGELRWSSDPTIGPDLVRLIEDAGDAAALEKDSPGRFHLLGDDVPVYICWLRNEVDTLFATVAVLCRTTGNPEAERRNFTFVFSLLRPALECLRRELLARVTINSLTQTVQSLDKDLELLLTDSVGARTAGSDGADELKAILQQCLDHLKCMLAALVVPEKGIVLLRAGGETPPDGAPLSRTHRQLLAMAQLRKEPLIINRVAPNGALGALPYRILSCPLAHASGRIMGVLALFRDEGAEHFVERDARIGDLLARKAVSVIESNYDAMSGLYTRPAFEQRMRAVVSSAKRGSQWSALYIDSDQLHVINDNFGMHVGDSVIAQLGELLRRRLPPGAFAARISGDRFAVLLPTSAEDAAAFAESLREGAEQVGTLHGDSRLHVSVSIGVAQLELDANAMMHSLAAAETACKAAKDRGRNRVEVYQTNDASMVRRFTDINIAARLRAAIDENRFRLDAQLIVPFGSSAELRPHYELLLRMIDEDGSTVGPDRFISAANRYQLMPTIDRWVIEKAIELLKPHRAWLADRPVVFAINFSGQSLNDAEFDAFLLDRIRNSGLNPSLFCFELTENATVANIKRAQTLMRSLRRLGCEIALDDFGTGLSSLSYLRELPVSLLKIDGSFVRDILTDARSESMVRAIAQLARSMSIGTVAEYVETETIRTRIASLGVDYGQGFAIGKPLPFTEVLGQLQVLASAVPVACAPEEQLPALRAANLH